MRTVDTRWRSTICSCLLAVAALFVVSPAWGADPLREKTSLGFVRDDVSFYLSTLRMREQVEKFANSKAFAKLTSLPFYQLAAIQVQAQWNNLDGPAAQFREVLESEAGQSALGVLKDAASEEMFIYADDEAAKFLNVMNQFSRISNQYQMQIAKELEDEEDEDGEEGKEDSDAEAEEDAEDTADEALQEMVDEFAKLVDQMEIPEFVIGFRVRDTQRAADQLTVLEPLLREALEEAPEIAAAVERKQVAGGDFLTLRLSGGMIPWDQVSQDIGPEMAEKVEQIKQKMIAKEVAIALGVRGEYLLFSVSGGLNSLEVDQSAKLLVERPELARLRDHADKLLTSVSYVSKSFLEAANQTEQQFQDMQDMVASALDSTELDDATRERITKDLKEFSEDVSRFIPKYGALIAFQYLTDTGYEGYTQSWTMPVDTDGSKPLSILQHVGGRPLFVIAGCRKQIGAYDTLAKWFGRLMSYTELPAVQEQLDDDGREIWQYFKDRLPKLCERFDTTMRESILPALKDGQIGIVLDARLTSTQWHKAMPTAEQGLPMPELTVMHSLSDAGRMRKGLEELWNMAGEVVDVVQDFVREHEAEIREESDESGEQFLDLLLDFKWPDPTSEQTPAGELFHLNLPEEWGVDAQVQPAIGIAQDVVVKSMSAATVKRLMQSEPLAVGGALASSDKPMAQAVYVNVAGLAETVKPWVAYVVDLASDQSAGPVFAMAEPQVVSLLEVLQCFQGYSAATTVEGDSLLTHQVWLFEDAKQ